ncbi:MAG: glutamine--tRNA ligase/YqeY domain fusion protein [Candidatus Vesicomyosocius endoextente]|uniref:Glutamine--tRNA ligase n=1 Tax=Candidatus Vesicomyosocius endoextente TaxID=2738853 RepID=A0A853GAY4_9GAMM|nr:glutamine--tRNA ligase/YqeY domain fusion protein [Candidatus Vesicomyosocius endoextente]
MNKNNTYTNFIRNQIDIDLEQKLHTSIQTRFPPEPNGYLHIGHAKSIFLNFGLAKDYKGRCNLRFDDTNPTKEDIKFIDAIKEDIKWLGFLWDGNIKYSSHYFKQFYEYATELINKNLAYVCFLDSDEIRTYRGTLKKVGKDSPYRNTSIEKNLELLAKMKAGKFLEGECVLRGKIDMRSSFMCMRDPTLYRIRFDKHHQTKNQWYIYPMYDFAHCISDAIEGVTHSLCTLEFQDNRRLYDWILENLDDFNKPNRPHQYEFSRLNLEYTVMSKRKLQILVENKLVSGWDDPRMPTISGLRRRGYTKVAIREFTNRVGISKVDNITDMKILEVAIRDNLNIVAPRTMGVIDPIRVIIENYPEGKLETLQAPIHPQNKTMGKRNIFFSRELYIDKADFKEIVPNKKFRRLAINKEVRLRSAYVINATTFDTDLSGNITTVYATYDSDTLGKNPKDGRKIKGVIHFVEASKALKAEFRLYDRLFILKKLGKNNNFEQLLNKQSLITNHGMVEPSMANSKPELAYQFEREGYFCRDNQSSNKLIFNKTIGLHNAWKG